MNKFILKGGWLLGALLWTLNCAADPALWAVQGRHNTLYLVGTIHVLPEDELLASNIKNAYQRSTHLVMELDMDSMDPLAMQGLTLQMGLLPDGESLASKLDGPTLRKLQQVSAELGVPAELLLRFQPWLAALTLQQLQFMQQGLSAQSGIEMQLLKAAQQDRKTITGLETAAQQLNLLAQMEPAAQLAFLRQTLDEMQQGADAIPKLLQAWRSGEATTLQAMMEQDFVGQPALRARLLTQRNQRWLTALKPLLEQPENYLVAVGALHLLGDQGLVALLKQAGYSVTRQ